MKAILILADGFIIFDDNGNYYAGDEAHRIKKNNQKTIKNVVMMSKDKIKKLIDKYIESGKM